MMIEERRSEIRPLSFYSDEGKMMSAQDSPVTATKKSLDTLKLLLSSSTPGGTPETLETQLDAVPDPPTKDDLDITTDIDDLISFVENFGFQSPFSAMGKVEGCNNRQPDTPPFHDTKKFSNQTIKTPHTMAVSQKRMPFLDRTNHGIPSSEAKLKQTLFINDTNLKELPTPTQEPDGLLLSGDRSQLESQSQMSEPNKEGQQMAGATPISEPAWEKFNQLVEKVEIALKEAWQEREDAKNWARQVRESTLEWVEEQRQSIGAERDTLLLSGNDNDSSCGTGADAAFYETTIERLENTVRGLELDLKTSDLHHQTNEKRLHDIIQFQQESLKKFKEMQHFTGFCNIQQASATNQAADPLRAKTPFPTSLLDEGSDGTLYCKSSVSNENLSDSPRKKRIHFSGGFQKTKPSRKLSVPLLETPKTHPKARPMGQLLRGTTPGSVGLHHHPSQFSTLQTKSKESVNFKYGTQKACTDSSSTIRYPNGNIKIVSPGPQGSVAYYHSKSQVIQVITRDGSEIYEFPNKQVERHYPDGRKIIRFPDGTKKRILPNGTVETFLPCGSLMVIEKPDGTKDVRNL